MTIVLLHGNPETEAIWDDFVPHLRGHDIVRLSPPGFGSAIPPGFDCSIDAYRDWAASRLTRGQRLESIRDVRPEIRQTLERAEDFEAPPHPEMRARW